MPGMRSVLADACLLLADDYAWMQLHVGDPGAAGTANVAVETDRVQITYTAPAAGAGNTRKIDNSNLLEWLGVAGAEDYTHYSMWTAATAGTCGHTGLVTADAVTIGNNFQIPIGSHVVSYPIAA